MKKIAAQSWKEKRCQKSCIGKATDSIHMQKTSSNKSTEIVNFRVAATFKTVKLISRILMKSAKVNFNSHQAIFLTPAATLQGPTPCFDKKKQKLD